jgi:ArsR family transcriptional regulator, arsenate/arsenite/antimonite-responsive transcriptional repressor
MANTRTRTDAHRTKDLELAALCNALGHPTRVAILRFLCQRGACICGDIVDQLPFAQATISQHLKVLKEAGLLQGTIDGPRVCYCADATAIHRLKTLLEEFRTKEVREC